MEAKWAIYLNVKSGVGGFIEGDIGTQSLQKSLPLEKQPKYSLSEGDSSQQEGLNWLKNAQYTHQFYHSEISPTFSVATHVSEQRYIWEDPYGNWKEK